MIIVIIYKPKMICFHNNNKNNVVFVYKLTNPNHINFNPTQFYSHAIVQTLFI